MRRMRTRLLVILSVLPTLPALGCGSEATASLPISISVAPATVRLHAGGHQDFTAMVANDPATAGVTWSLTGCSGGAPECGSLTNVTSTTATYNAPATVPSGSLGVTATSVTDHTKSFMATMVVTAINEQLAFASWRSDTGHAQIYVMNADGSGVTRLSDRLGNEMNPAWSPDGAKLAFASNRTGNPEIYVMNADGSGVTRLTYTTRENENPDWSPDGAKLAFMSIGPGLNDNFRIYVMKADGSGVTDLTPAGYTAAWRPRWSPDGTKIVFEGRGISVMNADGSGVTQLTNTNEFDPDWSPDGNRIAFTSYRDGNGEIYVMNVEGTGLTRLTNNPALDFSPVWKP